MSPVARSWSARAISSADPLLVKASGAAAARGGGGGAARRAATGAAPAARGAATTAVSLEAAVPEDVPSSSAGAASFKPSKPEDKLARLSLFTAEYPSALTLTQHLSSMMLRCCCASLVLMRLFCTLWAESAFQYRIFGNYFTKLQMNYFNYLTMIFLCLAPQRFHFLKSGRVGRAASRGE